MWKYDGKNHISTVFILHIISRLQSLSKTVYEGFQKFKNPQKSHQIRKPT